MEITKPHCWDMAVMPRFGRYIDKILKLWGIESEAVSWYKNRGYHVLVSVSAHAKPAALFSRLFYRWQVMINAVTTVMAWLVPLVAVKYVDSVAIQQFTQQFTFTTIQTIQALNLI
jgi:hypothetical protein